MMIIIHILARVFMNDWSSRIAKNVCLANFYFSIWIRDILMLPGRKTMTGFAIVEDIVKEMLKV